ncbi:MAG: hypothetical protein M1820_002278 [Bogoriella megaspora]|nr:MAG: hypothetical protein M1820_002278 [Bogoriella megaspora]
MDSSEFSQSTQAAFRKAVQMLETLLSDDERLREFLSSHTDIVGVHNAVAEAQRRFERNGNSKTRKWITRLSARIHLYGKVLDVFVQQHPEYASLVWGTFKLLFVGIVNQEELTKELAKALCRIADALPQTERDLLLYPSDDMEDLVATLYAHVTSFAQRAVQWYTESRIKHAVSSNTTVQSAFQRHGD